MASTALVRKLSLLGFLFAGAAAAQQVVVLPAPSGPVAAAATRAATTTNGLMWKAVSPTNTVYLVGSMHAGSPDMYPLPDQMEEAFRNSSTLVVEFDINRVGPAKMMALISSIGMYPDGDGLWNHISPHTRSLLTEFCTSHSLAPELFARFKPWMAENVLSTQLLQASGMQAELGIDMHFLGLAKSGKRIVELESAEQQVGWLAQIPASDQEKALASSVEHADEFQPMMNRMKTAWLQGDAASLSALLLREVESSPALRKIMFTDRNTQMAAAITGYLRGREPSFVVVGAGHLVGSDGIVSLLRKRGFHVEQVLAQ